MRRLQVVVWVIAIVAVPASPAMADEPVLAAEGFEFQYSIENPCSGGEIIVTETADVYEHMSHPSNFVSQPEITVTADGGFEGFALDIGVVSAGGELVNHMVMLRNPTTGEKVQVTIRGRAGFEVQEVRCVGN